jgi:predicted DCC family thiol-disulfide oxidoreductase YuxK
MPTPLRVYYDGGCPVCSREIAFYKNRAGAEAVDWVDASRIEPVSLGGDLSKRDALARLHVRRGDGTLVSGAAAFSEIWRVTPGFRWLGRLLSLPPFDTLAELAYRAFLIVRKLWR